MNIPSYVHLKQEQLSQHNLITWMRGGPNPISFYPAMTFFVLGFKDLLGYLKKPIPKSDIERAINQHCIEDSHHWLWFLNDMKQLQIEQTETGKHSSSLLELIWQDNNFSSRDMIYSLIHLAKTYSDAVSHLAMIECLEAAFASFIDALHPHFDKPYWNKNLTYFGSRHHESEASHEMGSWIETHNQPPQVGFLEGIKMNDEQRELIDFVFDKFDRMFTVWLSQVNLGVNSYKPPVTYSENLLIK